MLLLLGLSDARARGHAYRIMREAFRGGLLT